MKRKPNNTRARMERAMRGLVRVNHVAVVDISTCERHVMVNLRTGRLIPPGEIGRAVCDVSHRWSLFIAALCAEPGGNRYMKFVLITTQSNYMAEHLTDLIEGYYQELAANCNAKHLLGPAWIAVPNDVEIEEAQAHQLFKALGAWAEPAAA
ncbi:hypothetical protein [Phytopseudomonas punonensis]|uniref:Uncharacterized protein n=1 Tax=Phytopseudomonas punonensis TaxID=1220495 RepID=A0A1M7LLJ9_9GAMM|nr:hypothetical protein [Pseudomonas punonensis]SHM78907.1 hypothetical protein SAMN05216288_4299 [Pseudomonas punonensis]